MTANETDEKLKQITSPKLQVKWPNLHVIHIFIEKSLKFVICTIKLSAP